MLTRRQAGLALLSVAAAASIPVVGRPAAAVINLPQPRTASGKPLMQALKARCSTREYADRALPTQVLSDLLWAAWGINRQQSGLRTAPSAHDYQDVDVYLAMADGAWIYEPKAHRLARQLSDDIRGETAIGQQFAKTAPLNLIYVSDAARMGRLSHDDRLFNGVADCAVIAENVYLFCASEGLATVLRGSIPREALAKRLGLKPSQVPYFAQTVGYPKAK